MFKRAFFSLAVLLILAGTSRAQIIQGGSSSGSSAPTQAQLNTLTYWSQYYGLSPKDYGAKGDTKFCYDGNSTGSTNFTSTSCATFTSADVGKVIEITTAGAAGITLHTTISAFTNSTTIVLGTSITPGSLTNVKFWYGTDDTTALQSWVTAINNGSATASSLTSHSGYIPRGGYYTTKPLQFINPTGLPCCQANGYGTPEPFTAKNAAEGLSIVGDGPSNSFIVIASGSNFNWSCSAADTGAFFYGGNTSGNWNWTNISGFGIIADPTTVQNDSSCSGVVGGFVSDGNAHEVVSNMEIEGFHDSSGLLAAHVIARDCFQSTYSAMQLYANDINGKYGINVTNSSGSVFVDCHFNADQWDGFNPSGALYNVSFWSAETAGLAISNSSITSEPSWDGPASGTELYFGSTFTTSGPLGSTTGGENEVVLENDQIDSIAGTITDVNVTGTGLVQMSINNSHLVNETSGSSTHLISNSSTTTGSYIKAFGGQFDCSAACSTGIANASTNATMYVYGTLNVGGNVTLSGSGLASIYAFFPVSGGWSGNGNITLGSNGVSSGVMGLAGSTSGTATFTAPAVAGTTANAVTSTNVLNAPGLQLAGSAPTITTPGTTPYVAVNTLMNSGNNDNKCTFALTTSTLTTALSPVKLCTFTLPNTATTWFWFCSFGWSNPAGTTPTFSMGVNWAQAPSTAFQDGNIWTAAAGTNLDAATATTTNANFVTTGTLTNAATIFTAYGSGTFTGSATSGTFSPTVSVSGTNATGTAVGGCAIQ